MEGPQTPGQSHQQWGVQSPPGSGPRQAGIGCNINVNDKNELIVRKVIPGGPAAFSSEIAVDDILLKVDGVNVVGETPEDIARRILGPEGYPITITTRSRNSLPGEPPNSEHTITMVRQQPVTMKGDFAERPVGLGAELARVEGGLFQVRKINAGGAAALTGKLQVGDLVEQIDRQSSAEVATNVDPISLLVGPPFSRVNLVVHSNGVSRYVHMVRTVPLLGEYMMKYTAYKNALTHAIIQPSPPPVGGMERTAGQAGPAFRQPLPTNPGTPGGFSRADMRQLDQRFQEVLGSPQAGPHARSPDASFSSPNPSRTSAASRSLESREESGSTEGMMSRSSTASRDSIALNVRVQFGDHVDSIRSVEGRDGTFVNWPHERNPKLNKSKMAQAGFIHVPDQEAEDKVMCVYCGLELGHWEENDDPWSSHQEAAPGCSFWRKSSTGSQRLSKDLFSGYGSPYHSLFRSAAADRMSLAAPSPVPEHPPQFAVF